MWSDLPLTVRYVLSFVIALAGAWALTPIAARLAHRHGFVDEPGGIHLHSEATPTLGGIAIAAVFIVVGLIVGGADGALITVLAAGTMLAVVGMIDDRVSLSPWLRLDLEAAAAVALWGAGVRAGVLGVTWFDLPLTILWVLAVVNAFNLIDNHDGIATVVAALSAAGIALIAGDSGYFLVTSFSLAVSGACLGFFLHNKPPATIFLGDAGSMFLGFLVASLTLKVDLPVGGVWTRIAVAVLLVAVPLFDESLVLLARLKEHRPIMAGSTDHSAHQLRDLGWSKRQVVVTIGGAQAACSLLAFAVARAGTAAVAWSALAAVGITWLLLLWTLLLKMPTPRREPAGAIGTVGTVAGGK